MSDINPTYDGLLTEQRNPRSLNIDQMSSAEVLACINAEDKTVPLAVEHALPQLTALVEAAVPVLAAGGHLLYVGAGTSGRLAVLDAAECPPTFSVDATCVQAMMAGGPSAFIKAIEGAEDDAIAGEKDMSDWLANLPSNRQVMVVGISASGSARYLHAALTTARQHGMPTGSITCTPNSQLAALADYPVEVVVGPEVVTGSTRMKAGTAQKLVLNMLSTTCMVQLGKTYENWMIDVKPTNAKLRQRAIRTVSQLASLSPEAAETVLQSSQWQVKPAVLMANRKVSLTQAMALLDASGGKLRVALQA
jgi:N-acetylmuramic acid 6-phosphate etherase